MRIFFYRILRFSCFVVPRVQLLLSIGVFEVSRSSFSQFLPYTAHLFCKYEGRRIFRLYAARVVTINPESPEKRNERWRPNQFKFSKTIPELAQDGKKRPATPGVPKRSPI
ncbi:hypothetical protein RvY_13074 [Ramazzottius varieornatus]|uniref:Uncharacterized protein n=1 Tax=Ramazzottius varieornatus TaxID=947166 RepID=A0A1D1VS09_RAMVA|nr:hypothetical protein RvY_13074 [Ramazzottius varieornatus]